MTAPTNENQANQASQDNKVSDKELNFRMLESKYQKELAQERTARLEAEKLAQEALRKQNVSEDEDDSEPYVDHKRLNKAMNKFGQNTQTEIQKAMEIAKDKAKEEVRREMWLESNPDFYDVLQNNAEKFAARSPKLAEAILKMPECFERQKLVYQNIKELGIDKPEQKAPSIQDKIDSNKKGLYYQPSGVGTAPYGSSSDFSQVGQKQAYNKMQELKNRLRLG